MTISSTTSRNDYIGNGTATTFVYDFFIFDETHLLITTISSLGVEKTLVLGVDYIVNGVQDDSGSIVLIIALPIGTALTIRRVVPILQQTLLRNQGAFPPEQVENALDYEVMIDQEQQNDIDASIKLPENEVPSDVATRIPPVSIRVGKYFAWDSSGNPTAVAVVVPGAITISSYMTTLLAAINASAAQAGLLLGNYDIIFLIGTGPIVTTPDGLHTYRLGVDNDGNPTSTQVT